MTDGHGRSTDEGRDEGRDRWRQTLKAKAATYSASRIGAVALIVIDVLTSPSGNPSRRVVMSSMLSIGTPTRPTSPSACGASES